MEPSGRNQQQTAANAEGGKRLQQAKTVATGCDPLPREVHGKQGVSRGLPPVAGGPLPVKEGVDVLLGSTVRGYLLLQSGHGH